MSSWSGKCPRTGGHLGPNLGVVELTIALHRVFDSPRDRILWDTGHQAYVHKMLTGRVAGFRPAAAAGRPVRLPQPGRVRARRHRELHASTALSYADGLAKAFALTRRDGPRGGRGHRRRGADRRHGVGGGEQHRRAPRTVPSSSWSTTTGARTHRPWAASPTMLAGLRTARGYERFLAWGKNTAAADAPWSASPSTRRCTRAQGGAEGLVAPQGLFVGLGLKYLGPIDGHDMAAVESALRRAARFGGPVLVHCVTEKGRGYAPAESARGGQLAHRRQRPAHRRPLRSPAPTWTVGLRRGAGRASAAERPERGGHHGGHAAAHRARGVAREVPGPGLRRRHRRAARGHLGRRHGHGRLAPGGRRVRHLPQSRLRPAADGRRPALLPGDVRARPGRRHRRDGPSHNGMWDLSLLRWCPACGSPHPGTRAPLRRAAAEAVEVSDGPDA